MAVWALFIWPMKPLTSLLFNLADNSFSELFTNSINFYSLRSDQSLSGVRLFVTP